MFYTRNGGHLPKMKLPIITLLCIVGFLFKHTAASQWVDPHDMNTNVKEKYMQPTLKRSASTSMVPEGVCTPCDDSSFCYSYLKRTIGLITKSAHVDKRNSEIYHGQIKFSLSPTDYDFIANFGKEEISLDRLRKLDTILSDAFKKSFIDEYLNKFQSFQLTIYSLIVNTHNLWLLAAISLLYVVFQLFKNNFSLAYVFKYLFLIVLIVDFGFRYNHLHQEAEEFNQGVVYSKECDPTQMSWSKWVTFVLSSKDCEKRVITPLDPFLYQIKNLIIVPMHAFGTGLGGFGKNMFTSLPWVVNIIMWPIMLIFTLALVLMVMTYLTGQKVELNIFPIFKIKFGGGGSRTENILTGPTVDRIMDNVLHRPMVQTVNVSLPAEKKRIEQKNDEAKPQFMITEKSTVSSGQSTYDGGEYKEVANDTGASGEPQLMTTEKNQVSSGQSTYDGSETKEIFNDTGASGEPHYVEDEETNKAGSSRNLCEKRTNTSYLVQEIPSSKLNIHLNDENRECKSIASDRESCSSGSGSLNGNVELSSKSCLESDSNNINAEFKLTNSKDESKANLSSKPTT